MMLMMQKSTIDAPMPNKIVAKHKYVRLAMKICIEA